MKQAINTYLQKNGFEALRLKAVFFDMDGVLFDSMPNHAKTWAVVAREYGLDLSPEEVYMNEGRTGESTINMLTQRQWGRAATDREVEELYARKCALFNQCEEAAPMPGAAEVLRCVKGAGLGIYVVTGSGQLSLLNRLQTNYPGYFSPDRLISSRDVRHGKPHPEPYLMALSRAGLQPWEALVVENAPLGVRSAVAARIFTVAVNTGPLQPQTLTDEGAHLVFPSMNALAEQWEELLAALEAQ